MSTESQPHTGSYSWGRLITLTGVKPLIAGTRVSLPVVKVRPTPQNRLTVLSEPLQHELSGYVKSQCDRAVCAEASMSGECLFSVETTSA